MRCFSFTHWRLPILPANPYGRFHVYGRTSQSFRTPIPLTCQNPTSLTPGSYHPSPTDFRAKTSSSPSFHLAAGPRVSPANTFGKGFPIYRRTSLFLGAYSRTPTSSFHVAAAPQFFASIVERLSFWERNPKTPPSPSPFFHLAAAPRVLPHLSSNVSVFRNPISVTLDS